MRKIPTTRIAWMRIMNIGEASKASGVSAKMIRYYESIGLVEAPLRSQSNYRVYQPEEVHALRFLKRARNLGFTLEETSHLLGLWRDKDRASADVKRIAQHHVKELRSKVESMQSMIATLEHLADCCSGDNRPNCPILDDLADPRKPRDALATAEPGANPDVRPRVAARAAR